MSSALHVAVGGLLIAACTADEPGPPPLTADELIDPEACRSCHPTHVRQWEGSMHAYAAEDPVFLAMNRRGQEETDGALGDFCVNCHAPLAVRQGLTTDGLNLADVPAHLRGVTCFFCHSVDAVEGEHNNPLRLATDGVLRGPIADPTPTHAHAAAYAPELDRLAPQSAAACGACHDIVTPAGVHLERTFSEWQESIFSKGAVGQLLTCGRCHMDGDDGLAAEAPGVGVRRIHDHTMAAVDVALTEFPRRDEQLAAVQAELDASLTKSLCVDPAIGGIIVQLDAAFVGHKFPSGAAQDRRLWLHLQAWLGDRVVYDSGAVSDDQSVAQVQAAGGDPRMWVLRDRGFDDEDQEVHMFWDVRRVQSEVLPQATTSDPADPAYDHSVRRIFPLPFPPPDRITAAVKLRPMGLDILADLVDSGHLAANVPARVPTFTVGDELMWVAGGPDCVR